jgi:hypothetical protein
MTAAIHADFEGGSIGKVEQVAENHFRCAVEGQSDQDGRNRQANWYYFRIDNAGGRPLTLDLVDLVGEYNYRAGTHAVTKGTRPVYSGDDRAWKHFRDTEVEWDEKTIRVRLRFTPAGNQVWIAHVAPYTTRHLDRLLSEFAGSRFLRREAIGKTVRGRDMPLLTVTDPTVPESGKKVVWLMARQHAWETGTSWVADGALRFLLSSDQEAARIRREVIFKIFPMADPDGVAGGGVRFNVNGYDLNRNWDAVDPAKMSEISAQRKAVLDWVDAGRRLDLFLTLHNTETAEYLEGPEPGDAARRLFRALEETTTFHPSRPLRPSGLATTPGKPGRMTVAQGLYHDRKIPALIMEQMVEYNSKLGRLPTVEDRLTFGAGLAKALAAAVAGSVQ